MKSFREDFFQEKTKKIIIISLVVLLIVVSFYSFKSVHYAERLLPKTKVNSINVGGLTLEQANKKLNAELTEAPFEIHLGSTLWKQIKRSDFGWQTDHLEELSRIKQKQKPFAWGITSLLGSQHNLPKRYDQTKVNQLVADLNTVLLETNAARVPTKNATIEWQEDQFVIVPEKQGDTFDVEAVKSALKEYLENGEDSLDTEDYYAQPVLTKEDSTLKKLKAKMNQLAKLEAVYTIGGKQLTIPTQELSSWLTTNEKAEVLLKQDQVTAFVTKLNEEYNTKANPTSFNSTLRGTVAVPVGIYNWTIDIPSEVAELSAQILKGENFNRTPKVVSDVENIQTSIGGTYVEVDLQNQHMWYYKDGALQFETDIVSGKPSTPTPPGLNYVRSKSMDQVLRGLNDDGSKYASPVRYWMPIDDTGVGLHDSDWQYAYGGDLWLYRGSHGCINTPPAKMAELYPMLEEGTPVLVF
ncbi:L,D-transpeptidase/peptidoglycan binding protein [Enterococcus raffinosus]|uniref:L,D-transpeptidase family protein n=1 Tax=Enterococcus raffinosus TaxID=71452 RepID=UPI001C0F724D|nr:L,D-transpeptidase family protein [Enterococcus raffinosus]MBU5362934.1 L,D-transpeptidase/peptidoglycan binding protein [Enterococcus raffinosus]